MGEDERAVRYAHGIGGRLQRNGVPGQLGAVAR